MEAKGNLIQISMFLKYGLISVKQSSIVDFQIGSKYVSVKITLKDFHSP